MGARRLVTVKLADAFVKRKRNVTFDERDVDDHVRGKSASFVQHVSAICRECRRRGILFIAANQKAESRLIDRDKMRGATYHEEWALVLEKLQGTSAGIAL